MAAAYQGKHTAESDRQDRRRTPGSRRVEPFEERLVLPGQARPLGIAGHPPHRLGETRVGATRARIGRGFLHLARWVASNPACMPASRTTPASG